MSNLDKKYYHNIDLDSNELKAARLYNLTNAQRLALASSLTANDKGYIVYDTDDHKSYLWDGNAWTSISGGSIIHSTATGTDTYITTVTGITSYTDGDAYIIQFTNGNTTSCTLNINNLGAIPLYKNNDGQLIGGDIQANGEMLCVYDATVPAFRVIGTSPNSLISYVTNADSVTLTKGMPVYAYSGQGDRMTVKRANNTSDATSAQTVGLVMSNSIGVNQKGFIMMQGLLDGLNIFPTSTWGDGNAVYLGNTAGSITPNKPYAPNHLVYLGFVTTASNGNAGRMYVKIQNGYELDEIHDVDLISKVPVTGDSLVREGDLWKAKNLDYLMIAYAIALG